MNCKFSIYLLFGICSFFNHMVISQEMPDGWASTDELFDLPIEEIIKGSYVEQNIKGEVSVISRSDMRARGLVTTDKLMEEVVIELYPAYTASSSAAHLRPKILFMLNGREIIGDTFKSSYPYIKKIDIKFIHRVEILSGPNIVRFGGGPYMGVVNIFLTASLPGRECCLPRHSFQPSSPAILKF